MMSEIEIMEEDKFNTTENYYSEEVISRNKKIKELIIELSINGDFHPPFPYVSFDGDTFKHYRLDREKEPTDLINNNNTIVHTLQWLNRYMWSNNNSFVHGDLTDDNIIYNEPYLWIIDFEPGITKENKLFNQDIFSLFIYYYNILIDLFDFGNSILIKNKRINENYIFELYNIDELKQLYLFIYKKKLTDEYNSSYDELYHKVIITVRNILNNINIGFRPVQVRHGFTIPRLSGGIKKTRKTYRKSRKTRRKNNNKLKARR